MKKYVAILPFAVLERLLVVEEDVVYVVESLSMYQVYNAKTRKYLGKITKDVFEKCLKEAKDFKVYDNSAVKKKLQGELNKIFFSKNKTVKKTSLHLIEAIVQQEL